MPTPLKTIDFFAHHSPFGAFASFTLGRHGKSGGFGREMGGPPAQQDVYIGYARPGAGAIAFPFYREAAEHSSAEAYTGEADSKTSAERRWRAFPVPR